MILSNEIVSPYAVLLDLEGYTGILNHIDCYSSKPLFSWKPNKQQETVMFGSNDQKSNYIGFWTTEFAIFTKGEIIHHIPGAFIKSSTNLATQKTINYIWQNIHQRYTFRKSEIKVTQADVVDYLKQVIDLEKSVIYHKGGSFEVAIAQLLNLQSINIETRGVNKVTKEDVENKQCEGFCKIHKLSLEHCPKAEVSHFVDQLDHWYRPSDF